jgi:hypothetical protein
MARAHARARGRWPGRSQPRCYSRQPSVVVTIFLESPEAWSQDNPHSWSPHYQISSAKRPIPALKALMSASL